jgi:pilus assembly protein Flp/PilA
MNTLGRFVARAIAFLRNEDGPTAVEYAVMLALIIVICLASIAVIGKNASATYSKVGASLASAS